MRQTIDQIYQDVISKTQRIKNANERSDFQVLAQEAYIAEDVRKLKQYLNILNREPAPVYVAEKNVVPHPHQSLKPNEEASGMLNPRVYNYFSNFNSPKNGVAIGNPAIYPLYANFGAYNKKNI